ncbi:hypothetical protein ABIE45_000365 [Methylobacterium sp. OAE515]|uniref:hypothetical protein n=1 Tax=Methylobacterium sp. OAE515 TaxID=2817895 RepID=UPI001789310A
MNRWLLLLVLSLFAPRASRSQGVQPKLRPPADDRPAWWSAIGSVAQALTSALALAATILAYRTTLDFRSRDEAKDELQITPVVSVTITDSAKIEFINQGFGPAIIKEVYVRSGDNVGFIRTKKISTEDLKGVEAAALGLLEYTFKKDFVDEFAQINKIDYTFYTSGNIPLAGEIIAKDSRLEFTSSNLNDLYSSKLINTKSRARIKRMINEGERAHNLGICYCSFTNAHCYFSALRGGHYSRRGKEVL